MLVNPAYRLVDRVDSLKVAMSELRIDSAVSHLVKLRHVETLLLFCQAYLLLDHTPIDYV